MVYVLGAAIPQTWQHVYTAVTRGRKSVFVLGNWEQLHIAISRCDTPRRTRLSHRLQESLRDQAECVEVMRNLGLLMARLLILLLFVLKSQESLS